MNNRVLTIITGFPVSVILFAAALSGRHELLGLLIGYITGIVNIQWLFRDTNKVIEKDVKAALRKYYISLFSRLGMITMVVVIASRFLPGWMYFLAIGIIAGVFLPLAAIITQQIRRERG
jgi:hypothetical protein